jgi:hypothetical protein
MGRFHYLASNGDFDDACDLDALLHPSEAFEHPSEVVKDPDLTLNEKRAILASWTSDAVRSRRFPHCDACLGENGPCTSTR